MDRSKVCVLFLFLIGCAANSESSESVDVGPCFNVFQLKVDTPTGIPLFSWTPNCQIGSLAVTEEHTGLPEWSFYGPFLSDTGKVTGISSNVHYGVLPPRAIELVPPAALIAGTSYRVTLFMMVPLGQDPERWSDLLRQVRPLG
jgi:hypothetical protein